MPLAATHKIIYIDEAHFRRDADKRRCWSPIGNSPIVYVNGSTENTNVYGAYTLDGKFHYKFAKKQLATITIKFFKHLIHIYKKIVLIVDRAKWHTAKAVWDFVNKNPQKIQLFLFPKASPELNPVEECWHQTRSIVTANKTFNNTGELKKSLRKQWNKQKFTHNIINYLCR